MEKQIEISCAVIEKLAEDVILIIYKKDYNVELKDVEEVEEVYKELANGKPVFSILDSTDQFVNFSKEAQNFLAQEGEMVSQLIAATVVLNNLPTRLLARFFISFHKPAYPTKIFKTRKEALAWIELLRKA